VELTCDNGSKEVPFVLLLELADHLVNRLLVDDRSE
jgi:hypothetical protein